jgi:hypothetical protein
MNNTSAVSKLILLIAGIVLLVAFPQIIGLIIGLAFLGFISRVTKNKIYQSKPYTEDYAFDYKGKIYETHNS